LKYKTVSYGRTFRLDKKVLGCRAKAMLRFVVETGPVAAAIRLATKNPVSLNQGKAKCF